MTIVDTDIIPVNSAIEDKKTISVGVDLSDSLFDYDMLLKDVESNGTESTRVEEDELFNTFFHEQDKKDHSLSPTLDKKLPTLMQWSPQQGQASCIMSIVLKCQQDVVVPMRIVFGSSTIETSQQQQSVSHHNGTSVWITLIATVPPLKETHSDSNRVPVSVCLFDAHDPDLATETLDIGTFTYCEGIKWANRKRALSCEPDECTKKKSTFDVKTSDQEDMDAQLLKLLAPYDPLLTAHDPIQNNWISPQSEASTVHWVSPSSHHSSSTQPNYTTSVPLAGSYPTPMSHTMLLPQDVFNRNTPPQQQPSVGMYGMFSMPPPPPPTTMLQKEGMYRAFLEMQQRQRHKSFSTQPNVMLHPNYMRQLYLQNTMTQQRQRQYSLAEAPDIPRRASAPTPTTTTPTTTASSNCTALNKAHLKLNGDLADMMVNWSMSEWQLGRRLVHFWRETTVDAEGNLTLVECGFEPMDQHVYHQQRMRDNVAAVAAAAAAAAAITNSPPGVSSMNTSHRSDTPIVISCIYWRERNDYYITSVDCIYLLESMIGIHFTVEEKNRIRRNLEGFRPLTVSKCKVDCADFFKLIMSFPHPKPRNIEKDVKVFAWRTLPHALRKIVRKYTPSYVTTAPLEPIQRPSSTCSPQHHLGF